MEDALLSDIDLLKVTYEELAHSLRETRSGGFASRRGALQVELAVGLVILAQETTNPTGKAALKAVYHAAGYECMAKADRDYKTVNRRLNITAKLFDVLGSEKIKGWWTGKDGTQAKISKVVTELAAYGFETHDDVADYIGVASNRTRVNRQSNDSQSLDATKAQLLAQYSDDQLCRFATELLNAVAARK